MGVFRGYWVSAGWFQCDRHVERAVLFIEVSTVAIDGTAIGSPAFLFALATNDSHSATDTKKTRINRAPTDTEEMRNWAI
jgi:hypothetical protein